MRFLAIRAAIAAVTLSLAACGGAASSTTSPGGAGNPSAASAGANTLTAADYRFTPTTLSVAPGATFTFTFQNTGTTTHSFTQSDLNINQDVSPGASTAITFTAPQSGTLNFHCEFHPTKMTGTIVIGGSGAGTATSPTATPSASSSGAGYGAGY